MKICKLCKSEILGDCSSEVTVVEKQDGQTCVNPSVEICKECSDKLLGIERNITELRYYFCIKCNKKVFELSPSTNWYEGCLFENSAGYGSEHDLDSFKIMICDDCLTEYKEK
jgi:hypothetical protein